jgi:hypothetical protein
VTAPTRLAPVEFVLTAMAAFDLARRPGAEIRGPKLIWWPALFVQPIGPVTYRLWGRRSGR